MEGGANVRSWLKRLARLVAALLACFGLLFLIATLTPLNVFWAEALRGEDYEEAGDVLIVLSGSAGEDGSMGWSSYLRTTYAATAFRNGGFKEVLVSGGTIASTPVSLAMGDFLRFQGIPAQAIHLETLSKSTRENALNCAALLKSMPGRKVLMTSDYHMFRARRAFARAGVSVAVQPVPDVLKRTNSRWSRWSCFVELFQETVKIGYYWMRGWI